jgi:hypothetical protein
LLGADEIGGFDNTRPSFLDDALAEFIARNGGPDLEAGSGLLDLAHRRDALDVDDEVGLDEAAFHADEEIGSACEYSRLASFLRQKRNGGLGRAGCFVSHIS